MNVADSSAFWRGCVYFRNACLPGWRDEHLHGPGLPTANYDAAAGKVGAVGRHSRHQPQRLVVPDRCMRPREGQHRPQLRFDYHEHRVPGEFDQIGSNLD